jgi:hypothetical protein
MRAGGIPRRDPPVRMERFKTVVVYSLVMRNSALLLETRTRGVLTMSRAVNRAMHLLTTLQCAMHTGKVSRDFRILLLHIVCVVSSQPSKYFNSFLNSSTMDSPNLTLYYTSDLRPELGFDGFFGGYQTLHQAQQAEPLRYLRRCAYIVVPIMRHNGRYIPLLNELPLHAPVLGVMNSASKRAYFMGMHITRERSPVVYLRIDLKVRHDAIPDVFFPMDVVVQTMLHEPTHTMHRHHGLRFFLRNYMLLRELEEDVTCREVEVAWEEISEQIAERGEMRGLTKLLFMPF